MKARTRSLAVASAASILLTACAGAFYWYWHIRMGEQILADKTVVTCAPSSKFVLTPNFPNQRNMQVDGEFYIKTADATAPLRITSRLLSLTVTGSSALHMVAYSGDGGETVEVLYGEVTAAKNYQSSYPEPDHLGPGQMSMVNQAIDLLEKETVDGKTMHELAKRFD